MTTSPAPGASADVPIRKAASVLLLREAADGFEVFIQHRVSTMDFAAGMVVYPGGRVDAQDGQAVSEGKLDGAPLAEHAQQWKHTSVHAEGPEQAQYLAGEILAAARREVFEETGLLLDPGQLHPWANWVTPAGFPRRFDTYFFVAALRADQDPRHQTTEAVVSKWVNPVALFASLERGEVKMMRPTQRTLLDAMERGSIEQIISSKPVISSVHPDPKDSQSGNAVRSTEQHFNS
ncbi:NUDIX hydrolase [Glutamicibacter arilaitensis]|uniref:NUDIX hydrolase n=1 Tax=Glutamicibacter arilaitensis TaxID=256701 RepID=UPI0018671ECA|nr:NUDIX domain-containing protein [Glutamicibacter arilaitensis]